MTRGSSIRYAVVAAIVLLARAASTQTFEVVTNAYTVGQAPVWDLNDPDFVIFNRDFHDGAGFQIYRAKLADGSGLTCLTCGPGATKPPNQVPVMRPQGDKILYHSWNGRVFTVGAPGFGGLGSQIYMMDPDGTDAVQLTQDVDNGEGRDNFHAYWSPDGNRIVWTHIHWNFVTSDGRGLWDVRVADYVDKDASGPHLENLTVVRPANGHFYETQWWAPDGSGFLFTESVESSLNLELFFCHLSQSAPLEPSTSCTAIDRLTDHLAWDEQAIFTPDMSKVIFMSTRDHPGFFNSYAETGAAAGIPAETDYLTVLPIFAIGFLQPIAPEATDLYEIDLATKALTRLTFDGDDGWIIPEFAWSPDGTKLLWTEQKYPDGVRVPLPLDPARQVGQAIGFAEDPVVPSIDPSHPGINGAVVARTRIGSYVSP